MVIWSDLQKLLAKKIDICENKNTQIQQTKQNNLKQE